ncbi:MAG: hypothetical protein AAF488_14290, partial [Planctomycetota bacterium]
VLRVVVEGVEEEEASETTVRLSAGWGNDGGAVHEGDLPGVVKSWACRGLSNEFVLTDFFASVDEQLRLHPGRELRELVVEVHHPACFVETVRTPMTRHVPSGDEDEVYLVRVRLLRPEFWPAFLLSVRDAQTRTHLQGVELRVHDNSTGMSIWGRNTESFLLHEGLSSPIALMGGHAPQEATVAGLALSTSRGDPVSLTALARRFPPKRGVMVSARAPGFAWGSISLDVTEGARELLLEPAAGLSLHLSNVELERYAALETEPMLCVYRIRKDGGNSAVHYERLDPTLEAEGLFLDGLTPGGYRVIVELGGGAWTKNPVLAHAEVLLGAGERRQVELALDAPPSAPARASIGGVISFPAPTVTWAEENVRLQIYFQPKQRWRKPDFEFSLADLPQVGGATPTWSFRVDDLPVGPYRVQLMPFLKAWIIDLPADGRQALELVIPDLAEVKVETVDAKTGKRAPRDHLHYRNEEPHPRQRQNDFTKADTEEPGLFRFWAAPGKVMVWAKYPSGADRDPGSGVVFELRAGFQAVKLPIEPVYAMRFEFREDGVALPVGDPGMFVMQNVRPVDHDGRVTRDGLQSTMLVEVSAPGVYEIHFDGLDDEEYHSLPSRQVEVQAGEALDVIVDLRRK